MKKRSLAKSLAMFLTWVVIGTSLGAFAGLTGMYLYLSPALPPINDLNNVEFQTPLRVYSLDNQLIGEFGEKRRDPISIDDAPAILLDAILAAEDDGFYEHSGVSFKSLLRATIELGTTGEIQTGGSTITMQVARNFFLTLDKTFSRKFNEILLALKIERELSKDEILELYLNKIYFGNRAYGVKSAAQIYYGKTLKELNIAQAAMIAGLPKAPSTYNPIANPSRALIRRDWILQRLLKLKKITNEEYELASNEPVSARYFGQNLDFSAPYVAEMAREKAIEMFGDDAYINGYKVYTTIDSRLQKAGQNALIEGLMDYDARHGFRGPERKLDPAELPALEDASAGAENTKKESVDTSKSAQLGAVNLVPWINELKKIPAYGELLPAAVIRLESDAISVLLATGKSVDIAWEHGLKSAKKHINENAVGRSPKQPDSFLALGDIIRVYQQADGTWFLGQVPKIQGALVALNPKDGAIQSLVGGFNFTHSSFNRVIQAKRQPGSNFKPFIYTAGLEAGLTPASILNDAPIVIDDVSLETAWRPENASGKFYGPTRLRKGLYLSRNLVSIRLLQSVGIDKAIKTVARFGIEADSMTRDLSMVLGSHVMTPLEVATGYAVFANGGYKVEPYIIHHIRDREDNILLSASPKVAKGQEATRYDESALPEQPQETDDATASPSEAEQESLEPVTVELDSQPAKGIVDSRIAYLMNSMLQDVVKRGTATRAKSLGRKDLAGKTGTTNGPTDAWFSGYNHHLVTTTWVGFDSNKKIGRREYGGVAALPIWIDYMKVALEGVPDQQIPRPNGIVSVRIDADTGERASPANPNGIYELFLKENAPKEVDMETLIQTEALRDSEPESIF